MKKLTPRYKKWLLHRQRKHVLGKRTRARIRHAEREKSRGAFMHVRSMLPDCTLDPTVHSGYNTFFAPSIMSFDENYLETLAFILDFRKYFHTRGMSRGTDGIRRRAFAEFATIERIDAGAGLVLAAEIDRYARARFGRINIYDNLWKENVFRFFLEAGLFDLLRVDPKTISPQPSDETKRETLRFVSGQTGSGRQADAVRRKLEELSEKDIGPKPAVYVAISEALANVGHAYPNWYRSWPFRPSRRWWVSGFWAESRKTVGVQLYDQGAGIPATLPRQTHWQLLTKLIPALDVERTDAGLIAAALEYGRTSTSHTGRGKGLAEMTQWIERMDAGYLKILSGAGEIMYRSGGRVDKRDLGAPFCGTLVEWEVPLDA